MGGIFYTHMLVCSHTPMQSETFFFFKKSCYFYFSPHKTLQSYKKNLLQYAHLDVDMQREEIPFENNKRCVKAINGH